jgi:A/G-specific adenine glycosylase
MSLPCVPASGRWRPSKAGSAGRVRRHVAGGLVRAAGEPLAAIAHGFTHYRLQLQPLQWREVALRARVADNDDLRWVARGELAALGIPAPIRKLLETMLPEGSP